MMTKHPVFLITGAGKGIGRAIVDELISRKKPGVFEPRLYLTSRTAADLGQASYAARQAGLEVATLALDLAAPGAAQRLATEAERAFGPVDCLVNNAGTGRFGRYDELTEADFDYVVDTNLKATFFLTQQVLASMEKRKQGHLIFITSVASEVPFEQSAIYCLSKFGQRGMIEVFRLYARKAGIRITNVLPGAAYTPMWGEQSPEMIARMMRPQDVARAVADAYFTAPGASIEEIVIRPVAGDL